MDYILIIHNLFQEHGNNRNDNQGWTDHTKGSKDGTWNSASLIAYKCGSVNSDDSRSTLPNGVIIQNLIFRYPVSFFYQFIFQHRKHGKTTAKGQTAYAEKCNIQIDKLFHENSSSYIFAYYLTLIDILNAVKNEDQP